MKCIHCGHDEDKHKAEDVEETYDPKLNKRELRWSGNVICDDCGCVTQGTVANFQEGAEGGNA